MVSFLNESIVFTYSLIKLEFAITPKCRPITSLYECILYYRIRLGTGVGQPCRGIQRPLNSKLAYQENATPVRD